MTFDEAITLVAELNAKLDRNGFVAALAISQTSGGTIARNHLSTSEPTGRDDNVVALMEEGIQRIKKDWKVAYTTMTGEHYIAELSVRGKHMITIKNRRCKTVVQEKEVLESGQKEAQALLRHWDNKKPFTNESV